jgi:hypothetical protein
VTAIENSGRLKRVNQESFKLICCPSRYQICSQKADGRNRQ